MEVDRAPLDGTHLAFELTHEAPLATKWARIAAWFARPRVRLLYPIQLQGYTIPAGFKTDWASIPWLVWVIIPIFGRSCKGAVLHDWLCYIGFNKVERSKLFLAQMLDDGVPKLQAWLQYAAVRYWPFSEAVDDEDVPATLVQ